MPTLQPQGSFDGHSAIALPPPLRDYLASLEGANDHSNRIDDSLSRLNNAVSLFEQALRLKDRDLGGILHDVESGIDSARAQTRGQLDLTEERVGEELGRAEKEVEAIWIRTRNECQDIQIKLLRDLEVVQERSRTDLEGLQKKLKGHVVDMRARNDDGFEKRATRVTNQFKEAYASIGQDLVDMMGALKATQVDVNRDVRDAQATWARMRSQMLALNTWAVAWPEAIRTVQHFQVSTTDGHATLPAYTTSAPATGGRGDSELHAASADEGGGGQTEAAPSAD